MFYNSLISGNHASNYGGGVRNEGQFGASISPEFVSSTISGNYATSQGGGMYNMYSSPIIADNVISHSEELRDFIDRAHEDERVDTLLLSIGKGELVCRKI